MAAPTVQPLALDEMTRGQIAHRLREIGLRLEVLETQAGALRCEEHQLLTVLADRTEVRDG